MSRISPLALLAQLMLKNHHELREALGTPMGLADPMQVGFKVGGASTSMSIGTSADGGLALTFSQNGHTYRLNVPSRADSAQTPKVTVTLEPAGGQPQEFVLEGSKLFDVKFSGPFAELHEKVLAYLKKTLSADRLNDLKSGGKPADTAPAKPTETPSPAQPAQSGTAEAPADVGAAADVPSAQEDRFRWFLVQRQDQPDLRFRGECKARAESPLRNGRQHAYTVFVTPSGKWVAIKQGLSMWLAERDIAEVKVVDKVEELVGFFGYGWLAKAIYDQLGLTAQVEEVLE